MTKVSKVIRAKRGLERRDGGELLHYGWDVPRDLLLRQERIKKIDVGRPPLVCLVVNRTDGLEPIPYLRGRDDSERTLYSLP